MFYKDKNPKLDVQEREKVLLWVGGLWFLSEIRICQISKIVSFFYCYNFENMSV